MIYNIISAEEAAEVISNGDVVGIGGFSSVGVPKVVTTALAAKAIKYHKEGKEFKVGLITGGSTGKSVDSVLANANAVSFRTPFQSNSEMRNAINNGNVSYYDSHLSLVPQDLRYGFLGKINVAIIEASEITKDGNIILSTSVGISPTLIHLADKIIIELNEQHEGKLTGMHDIYEPTDLPFRKEIPLYSVNDRIGNNYIKIDSKKVVGIVRTCEHDSISAFTPMNEITQRIGSNVANFLLHEWKRGAIPQNFLPLQSGVGNIANAVLGGLGEDKNLPPLTMFTEVIQNSVIDLMGKGRINFATGCSLTVSEEYLETIYNNLEFFKNKILLRPQEITNHPEIVRRLGIIAINTALEADIFGNINSTHILGNKLMNGVGGSADFARNAYLSIFTTPSTAKNGLISSIVPQVSHVDSTEHDVRILATEYGIADLRGKSPLQRAECIINNCAHPDYRELLWDYVRISQGKGHTPFSLKNALKMHIAYAEYGDMKKTIFE